MNYFASPKPNELDLFQARTEDTLEKKTVRGPETAALPSCYLVLSQLKIAWYYCAYDGKKKKVPVKTKIAMGELCSSLTLYRCLMIWQVWNELINALSAWAETKSSRFTPVMSKHWAERRKPSSYMSMIHPVWQVSLKACPPTLWYC